SVGANRDRIGRATTRVPIQVHEFLHFPRVKVGVISSRRSRRVAAEPSQAPPKTRPSRPPKFANASVDGGRSGLQEDLAPGGRSGWAGGRRREASAPILDFGDAAIGESSIG